MANENAKGSIMANVAAMLAVVGALGALYLPILLH